MNLTPVKVKLGRQRLSGDFERCSSEQRKGKHGTECDSEWLVLDYFISAGHTRATHDNI